MPARRSTRWPWPLFVAIATIAAAFWWLDLRKNRRRRFLTERPLEVPLPSHAGHGEVVNRASAKPSTLRDIEWRDKTIELIETAEEAVVSKSAYVAEEVVISKTGIDRVETVRETVRRHQVELEKFRLRKGEEAPN